MKLTATGIAILGIMCLASVMLWNATSNGVFVLISALSFVGLIAGIFLGVKGTMRMGI